MTDPLFVIPLADLERGPKELDTAVPVAWLAQALEGTEAEPRGTPGHLAATVQKTGCEVIVRGRIAAQVTMPCARTLLPTDVDIDGEVFLLLSPRPTSSSAHPPGTEAPSGAKHERPRKRGRRPTQTEAEPADRLLSETEAAEDVYSGDDVVLDGFLREFLLLELPLFPLHPSASDAISSPPREHGEARPVDPRLAPLAALAGRMRKDKD